MGAIFTVVILSLFILFLAQIIGAKPTKEERERNEKRVLQHRRKQYEDELKVIEEKKSLDQGILDLIAGDILPENTDINFHVSGVPDDFSEKEFTSIDFETANRSPLSAVSLGIAHFRGPRLLDVKEFRFRPIDGGRFIFTDLHGIKKEDVIDLPTFAEQWDDIKPHLDRRHLVSHNFEFEEDILRSLLGEAGQRLTACKKSCTLKLARRFMRYESSYKLENLCGSYKIPYWHHQAAHDAISAGILFAVTLSNSPGGAVTDSAMSGTRFSVTAARKS